MSAGPHEGHAKGWLSRIGWFVLLWTGGVVTVGAVAYGIRLVLL